MSDKYNGYSNKPTWSVMLWAYNDSEGAAEYHDEMACDALSDNDGDKEAATWQLAARLESEYDKSNPLTDKPGVYSEILSWALAMVNWTEIAEHMINDLYDEWKADNGDDDDD